jgi:hypothetical protein
VFSDLQAKSIDILAFMLCDDMTKKMIRGGYLTTATTKIKDRMCAVQSCANPFK